MNLDDLVCGGYLESVAREREYEISGNWPPGCRRYTFAEISGLLSEVEAIRGHVQRLAAEEKNSRP